MKNKFLTYKFLPILLLSCIIFSFTCTNCYASNIDYSNNIFKINLPNISDVPEYQSGEYYYFARAYSTYITILFIKKDLYPRAYYTNGTLYFKDNYEGIEYTANHDYGTIDINSKKNIQASYWFVQQIDGKPAIDTNSTIYTDNTCTNVFFCPTPVTIPALETVEQIPTAIITALRTIIPIGLVILSMVLLIYLIKSVILRAR